MNLEWDGFDWEHNCTIIVFDALGYKEFQQADTPNIDKVVDKEFHNAVSPGSFTPSAFQGFFVGHTPYDGSETQVFGRPLWLSSEFKKNGYKTMAWSSLPYFGSYYGFDKGFDSFVDMRRQNMCEEIVRQSTRAIKESEGKIFVMLDFGETHRPFDFNDSRTDWKKEPLEEYNYDENNAVSEEYLAYLRERQVQSMEYLDEQLGPLLDLLVEEDFFIMMTSDHGTCHGEAHLEGHGIKFHRQMQHVPLMFRLPTK